MITTLMLLALAVMLVLIGSGQGLFHFQIYQGLPGVNAASFDLTAVAEPDFSTRNGHFIYTEQYRLLTALHMETSATNANFSCPTWNAIGKANIWPVNRAITVQSPPRVDVRFDSPPPIPLNEEFQCQASNNLGAATEQAYVGYQIITNDWNANIPTGRLPILVKTTATYNPGSLVWSGANALTFEQSLRGGVYAVIGAECFGTNLIAFRLIFPRQRMYNGRKLRPGWWCQQAIGDQIYPGQIDGPYSWGIWGLFHTFEPPQIESIMTTGASTAHVCMLYLMFLGEDQRLLDQWAGTGGIPTMQTLGMGA